jgi:hypothetical protein
MPASGIVLCKHRSQHRFLQEVQEVIAALSTNTMFLLQRRGPTCFVLKDGSTGLNNTVQIGAMQSCTCQRKCKAATTELCTHIVFVMVKVLRIPAGNPIVWQHSLTGVWGWHVLTSATCPAQQQALFGTCVCKTFG